MQEMYWETACALRLCKTARLHLYDIDAEASGRFQDYSLCHQSERKRGQSRHQDLSWEWKNRKDALRDATFVVNAIQVGGYEPCTVTDFEIPKKYGLQQTIADTLGIGGIMRGLRTIPVLEEFARDMEEVCPDALFPKLFQSHGNSDRLYAALHKDQNGGSLPQCTGLLGRSF